MEGRRKLYIDLDDTFVETESFLRMMFKQNGISIPQKDSVYSMLNKGYDFLFKEGMSDYTLIPRMPGAEDALRILSTEYEPVFISCYTFEEEAEGKKKLARAFHKNIILCDGSKDHIDMENAVFIDDTVQHLVESNASEEDKYLFFNLYNLRDLISTKYAGHVVSDWYDITNMLMGVTGTDAKLREYFCEGIQKFSAGGRV